MDPHDSMYIFAENVNLLNAATFECTKRNGSSSNPDGLCDR